jgi:hypothetical protein
MSNTFNQYKINEMNKTELWNGSINTPINSKEDTTYKLHATGNASISNGRVYVSLPANLKITNKIKKKYNIM